MIEKKPRVYIPENLEINWENLEPLFLELRDREIYSVEDLERWMYKRSERIVALVEDFFWRYIRMTCDTADVKLLQDFQYFATEIEPKIAPLPNELNKKFIENHFLDQLDEHKYFVYKR